MGQGRVSKSRRVGGEGGGGGGCCKSERPIMTQVTFLYALDMQYDH